MSRPSFQRIQVEAFISWHNRLSKDSDPASSFEFWSSTKDFHPADKLTIEVLVFDLLQRRVSGEMLPNCLTFNLIGAPEGGSKS